MSWEGQRPRRLQEFVSRGSPPDPGFECLIDHEPLNSGVQQE